MATVTLVERNGAGSGVDTSDPSSLNFGGRDASNLTPEDSPIAVRDTEVRSFEKWLKLIVVLGDSVQVDNFRVWQDSGELRSGEKIYSNVTHFSEDYTQLTYQSPSTGSVNATHKIPTRQPPQANLGIEGNLLGAITSATIEKETDWCVLQLSVTPNDELKFGAVNQKIFVFQYDEQ